MSENLTEALTAHRVECAWCKARNIMPYNEHREHLAGVVEAILAARLAERDARLSDAWDRGWLASKRHERSEGQPKMTLWPNPYAAALRSDAHTEQKGEGDG